MAIPTYQSVMLPMLEMCADGAPHHTAGLAEPIADHGPRRRGAYPGSGQSQAEAERLPSTTGIQE